jgi:hypothetical protein
LARSLSMSSMPRFVASSAASAAGLSPAVANACSLRRNSLTVASVRARALSSSAFGAPPLATNHDVQRREAVAQTGGGDDDEGEERHEQDEQELGAEARPRRQRLPSLQASQIELHPFPPLPRPQSGRRLAVARATLMWRNGRPGAWLE